jgi:hypothetical protein
MQNTLDSDSLRRIIRKAIQRKFVDLVKNVKSSTGSLADTAAQLGVKRPMLNQYAEGSIPGSDVLLAAFLKWDWVIRIEMPGGVPEWVEFSVSDRAGGVQDRKREPVQLSLFEALEDLDQNLTVLKRSVGRVEFEVQRAFSKDA